MSKFISTSNLSKLSKALDKRCIDLINEEKERAMGIEQGLQTSVSNKADANHNHDDRYFTETEMNTKIGEINEAINGHVADLNAAISGKADTGHNHDDRYFTETEVTTKLAGKADTGHAHDDMYYTETEIDGKITTINNAIAGKANTGHTHDDRYYTETEINGKIEDINESISSNVSTLEGKIATAKSGAISESKSYTDTAISKLVDSAPEAMNTLNELAKAIGDHQTEYEAYVATVSTNIATAKAEAIAEAAKKDTALHTTISAEIDADVKVEKERAMEAEDALQAAINGKANASHGNHVPATQTADNTKFLRNDNTWATVTPANIGAAAASHGNHVPATQTADNTKFLRNDNTWATVTPANIGAAAASHTHDDRYFTETEINGKIEDINETINGHVADLEAAINGKAPTSHTHDDRYYTETEMNTKLAGKSDTNHTHDDRYYTESEIDGKITTLNNAINGKAPTSHTHDDRYFTETEINGKIEDINETINSKEAALQSRITELEAALNPEVHEVSVSGGVLTLTDKKYQKCNNVVDGTEIVFPSVSKFTEIHLYFDADSNMNLTFPDCKWRVEPNIEEGGTYEVIATYNTIHWLVTIIAYS